MNWSGKKVLVTGAGGFIGSHVAERLVELGADVRALVRYNSAGTRGHLDRLPVHRAEAIDVYAGNLLDARSVNGAVAGREIVLHLGALIAVPYSYRHPGEILSANVLGTYNVLEAAREAGVERIVLASTSEVYGTAQTVPMDETHPLQAQSPYAASKIAADQLGLSFWRSYDLPVTILRPFNTYGPRQSARAIVPTIITQALISGRVFLGSMYPTRDLSYVADIVEGFVKVVESPGTVGEVIHIGSGKEISIGDLSEKIVALLNKPIEIVFDSQRVRPAASEVGRLVCDYSKAKSLIGWEPRTSLEDGLKRTLEWFAGNLTPYDPKRYVI